MSLSYLSLVSIFARRDHSAPEKRTSMRIPALSNNEGFTLLELMVVLMLISVLGAVTVPTYMEYMRESKTAEAGPNLLQLKKGAVLYFHSKRADATGDSLSNQFLDAVVCTSSGNQIGMRQQYLASDFVPGSDLSQLQFSISEPHYYRYCYVGDAFDFVISSTASLDKTNDSIYTLTGFVDPANGAPTINDVVKEK